jgi:hypothetical protein
VFEHIPLHGTEVVLNSRPCGNEHFRELDEAVIEFTETFILDFGVEI